jgi:outer membrane protein OmpA-like peptidoglycan-associated protein
VVLVSGKAVDASTGEPIVARIAYERLRDGEEMGIAFANTVTGFSVALPQGERYGIYAEAEGYYAVTDNIDLTSLEGFRRVEKDIRMEPLTVGAVIRLNNIFFDTGASTLREESYPELNRLVRLLEDNPTMQIALGGYTDNVGGEDANLALSRDRANSVMQYLLSQGIAADRLTAAGYGEASPVASNDTEEGRQLNRRVEFSVVSR